ncbi:hypothetical protein BYT27DRAFT_7190388 [Phlegmacium glaucopus]|nr:hypothetical protein BYT27DRAFT_7190388 [Phlegmacium glaucopus]
MSTLVFSVTQSKLLNESTLVRATQLLVTAMLPFEFPECYHIWGTLRFHLDLGSSHPWPSVSDCTRRMVIHEYRHLILEFLGDPTRSKEFYVDGNIFATLATAFAKILFGLSVSRTQIYSNTTLKHEQKRDPLLECAFSSLPDCLLKASPSKDLALFLQNHKIPSSLHKKLFDGHSSEATVAAIKAYILVCLFVLCIYFEIEPSIEMQCL